MSDLFQPALRVRLDRRAARLHVAILAGQPVGKRRGGVAKRVRNGARQRRRTQRRVAQAGHQLPELAGASEAAPQRPHQEGQRQQHHDRDPDGIQRVGRPPDAEPGTVGGVHHRHERERHNPRQVERSGGPAPTGIAGAETTKHQHGRRRHEQAIGRCLDCRRDIRHRLVIDHVERPDPVVPRSAEQLSGHVHERDQQIAGGHQHALARPLQPARRKREQEMHHERERQPLAQQAHPGHERRIRRPQTPPDPGQPGGREQRPHPVVGPARPGDQPSTGVDDAHERRQHGACERDPRRVTRDHHRELESGQRCRADPDRRQRLPEAGARRRGPPHRAGG